MKKMSLSLRLRLSLSFLFIATAIWLTAGALSWVETREEMDEFFDTYQTLLARQLSTVDWKNIKPDTQQKTNKIINSLANEGENDDDALGFAIFNNESEMIFNDGENGKYFSYNNNPTGFINQTIGKKDKWRIIWVKTADEKFIIAVGQEIEFRDEAASELVEQALIPWLIGLIVLIIASLYLISRELRPLKYIEKNLSTRKSNDLSPIVVDNQPKEIKPLLISMNKLFERIEDMLNRERSFISDAAHELRSPLTALNVQLEVALLAADDEQVRNNALEMLNQGIKRSSRMVEQLLSLSKLETLPFTEDEKNNIEWDKIVDDIITEYSFAAKMKDISIKYQNKNNPPISKGEPLLCSLLLRNLLDNAIKYGTTKSEINISIENYELIITNSNSIVDEKYINLLGDRFFRPPGQKENGSGLGLSIVKRVAQLHDCEVSYENTNKGFSVAICKA